MQCFPFSSHQWLYLEKVNKSDGCLWSPSLVSKLLFSFPLCKYVMPSNSLYSFQLCWLQLHNFWKLLKHLPPAPAKTTPSVAQPERSMNHTVFWFALNYNETFLPKHARPSSLPGALTRTCFAPLAPFFPTWAWEPAPHQLIVLIAWDVRTKAPWKRLASTCQIHSQGCMRFLTVVCGSLLSSWVFQQMSGVG